MSKKRSKSSHLSYKFPKYSHKKVAKTIKRYSKRGQKTFDMPSICQNMLNNMQSLLNAFSLGRISITS